MPPQSQVSTFFRKELGFLFSCLTFRFYLFCHFIRLTTLLIVSYVTSHLLCTENIILFGSFYRHFDTVYLDRIEMNTFMK